MPYRYLFGPVSGHYADQLLHRRRQAGDCLTFNADGSADVKIEPTDTWEAVGQRLPSGWQPDFAALYLPYTNMPACLWSAPLPLVGLAADWNLLWHQYRRRLPDCDLILTDTIGVEVLAREGITHARAANLFGCERVLLETAWPDGPRDIDILFLGNLHPAVQRARLPWLGRIGRLSDRRRVVIGMGMFGEEYRKFLVRARIVFNRAIRGECNLRAFEAAAAGALLFQEAGNREVPAYFRDRQECVFYTDEDLEELLDYYLENEDERCRIAKAAQERVREYGFGQLWQQIVRDVIDPEWGGMVERARQRVGRIFNPSREMEVGTTKTQDGLKIRPTTDDLLVRTWEALNSNGAIDPCLEHDLAAALAEQPLSADLHHAMGMVVARTVQGLDQVTAEVAEKAAAHFQRALSCDPTHLLAGLNWLETMVILRQRQGRQLGNPSYDPALDLARRLLALLDRPAPPRSRIWEAGHIPLGFNLFRVEWEQAAWMHEGQPAAEEHAKRELIRWQLYTLLAKLTGELPYFYEAVTTRPDLLSSRLALGDALRQAGQFREAIRHLRRAVADNPFDVDAARQLFQSLGSAGDGEGQRRLADERRLLARAAPQAVPMEEWMAKVPPPGDELASIIILCCNEVELTRTCLESVWKHTRASYELILVDNGSTDGTPAFLEEVKSRPGPARVVVIRNEVNRGFAPGCNQALARARGRYVVFLNNDTQVTAGWLAGLIAWAVSDWPQVGLVGPMSNYAPVPQLYAGRYPGPAGIDAFAAWLAQENAGKAVPVWRLTGFCLLVRREVLQQVGVFDEGYGLGFFEDDDLCIRAREAGFKLLAAQNVFVHHEGSRTFAHLGIDCRQQLRTNFAQFQAKWGLERAAGYQLPEEPASWGRHSCLPEPPGPEPLPENGRQECLPHPSNATPCGVSLCIIVKNEEHNLPACLDSAADLVDEVIVVDTGSSDRTREIAQQRGAKVFEFAWVDSFAAARNECLRHATGEWIFWMDADDRLDDSNREKLRALFAGLNDDSAAYSMKCVCVAESPEGTATVVDHIRLFRNHPEVRWQYRVHEQILPGVRRLGGMVRATDIRIHHVGYTDPALRLRKHQRDFRLLQLDLADHPDDPFILFNLGWSLEQQGKPVEALPLLRRSLERSHPGDSIVRKLFTLIMECHRRLGQPNEALAVCAEGRRWYPDDAQLLFQEGLLRDSQADDAAEACWLRLIGTTDSPHFASVAEGLRGYKARHQLALHYDRRGRHAEAEAQWQAALKERPDFTPAWLGLGDLYVRQGMAGQLEALARRLEQAGPANRAVLGVVLRARGSMARRDWATARQMLEEALDRNPRELMLWVVLSHVLLQEGRDADRAEQALLRVLELDPANAEARSNLALLRQRRGQLVGV
jgi:GT2 family glycosyltransferase/tetratricopeptide (TPR) repeat protein